MRAIILTIIYTVCLLSSFSMAVEPVYLDWAECVLNKMPAVKNDLEANNTLEKCKRNYPKPEKHGTGCGGYTIKDCMNKYVNGTETAKALDYMRQACGKWHSAELKMTPGS